MAFTGSSWFHPPYSVFLGCCPLFSIGILDAWHYVHHSLIMLEIGSWMLTELRTRACEKGRRLGGFMGIPIHENGGSIQRSFKRAMMNLK